MADEVAHQLWATSAGNIARFAGSLSARILLQVSSSFASNPECIDVAQHGALVLGGQSRLHPPSGWTDFLPGARYDAYDEVWPPLPLSWRHRDSSMLAVLGEFLYAIGGQHPLTGAVTRTVMRCNLVDGREWQERSSMLQPRTEGGLTVLGGRLYVLGGHQLSTSPSPEMLGYVLNSVECYCPRSDEWQMCPPMLHPRTVPRGVAVIDQFLYVVDGLDYWDGEEGEIEWHPEPAFEPYAEKFSPALQLWEPLPQRLGPRPLDHVAVAALHDMLYLAGGLHTYVSGHRYATADVRSIQRYIPRSNSWEMLPPMSTPRYHAVATGIGGRLYVFGGRQSSQEDIFSDRNVATVERYDPVAGVWETLNPMPAPLGRGFYVATLKPRNHVYLIGFDETQEFDPETQKFGWRPEHPVVSCFKPCSNHWDVLPSPNYSQCFHLPLAAVRGSIRGTSPITLGMKLRETFAEIDVSALFETGS